MNVNFKKYYDGLAPAIIQDDKTGTVLMLGFMNQEALEKTDQTGRVTFFSRSRKCLWTKGEESGHYLLVKSILLDCDKDTLLIKAQPQGAVCHLGNDTCWNESNKPQGFLFYLEEVIARRKNLPGGQSYIAALFSKGINKIAQKVGEEAVELAIESKDDDDTLFLNESADLLFHFLILLNAKGHNLQRVIDVLEQRHTK